MKRHLLKQKMVDNNDTMKMLAQVLDIAPNTLYRKMQGTVQEFTQTEIRKIAERYDLTAEEIKDIFFKTKHRVNNESGDLVLYLGDLREG